MSLSENNSDNSTSILSIQEIIGIIVVFSFMLYLLFPKKNIDEILKHKGENRNLSINYLESMLLYYPDNVKLELILLRNYSSSNNIDKVVKLIGKLKSQTEDREILDEVYMIEYELLKERYFQNKDKELLQEIRQKLYEYFEFKRGERDYMFFLTEAFQMDFKRLKYISLKGLISQKPELRDYNLEKELFFLASSLGYKEEANEYLLRLASYSNVGKEFQDNALSLMLKQKQYKEAIKLSKKLFLSAKGEEEIEKYFNIALYAISLNSKNSKREIAKLINLYKRSRKLKAHNIYFILDNLLKVGDIQGASKFAVESFKKHREKFDEPIVDLAIKSLIYTQKLKPALKIALYAKDRFHSSKWLDKAIELSIWQGKMDYALELNVLGYRTFKARKYKDYISKNRRPPTLHHHQTKPPIERYREMLAHGDYSKIDEVAEYYKYVGKILEGERYFTKLLKRGYNRAVLKKVIEFSYKNRHYRKGLKFYKKYRDRYGMDRELQKESIKYLKKLGRLKMAYALLKELNRYEKYDYSTLMKLAEKYKEYNYIYNSLWSLEKQGKLPEWEYSRLGRLDRKLNGGKRLEYLYKRVWKRTGKRDYIKTLMYLYMERKEYKKFGKLLKSIKRKDRELFAKDIDYHTLLASYYINTSQNGKALAEFKRAFKLKPKDIPTHQAYIWFLLDNKLTKLLKQELKLLEKNPKLQRGVGFPAVVTALMFQKSDLALKWIRPLMKSTDRMEYKVVYSDILELQDRVNGAKKVRLKLFKELNRMIRKSPKLLKDKAFARVYLRLVVMYTTPFEKRNMYFKKLKSLFKKQDFMEMKLAWKTYTQSYSKAKYLVAKHKLDVPWLSLYLAISRGDNQAKQELLKDYRDTLAFRDRVTASKDIGDISGAYSLAFQGMEENSRDTDIYKIYSDMVNRDYPKGDMKVKYSNLSKVILAISEQVSYRWHLFKGIESKFSFDRYKYIDQKGEDFRDNKLGIALRNSHKRLIWNFEIAKHFAQKDFISSILDINYRNSEIQLGVKVKYHTKTAQTNLLHMIGIQNSVQVTAKRQISKRFGVGASYKESDFMVQDRRSIGKGRELKLSANYLFRAGYPDIQLTTYLLINRFRDVKRNLLPKQYMELGSQLSIGAINSKTIHRDWRPFGIFGLSINDTQNIGTTLSLGLSGEVMGEDVLSFSFDYGKGIDMITSPSYGLSMDYRF